MNLQIMNLDNIYIKIPLNEVEAPLMDIINKYIGDKDRMIEQLISYEENAIDTVVCGLMYYRDDKGPKFIKRNMRIIVSVALARFTQVLVRQCKDAPFKTNDSLVFGIPIAEVIQSFRKVPFFAASVADFTIDAIEDGNVSQINNCNLALLLYQSLCDEIKGNQYYKNAEELLIGSANQSSLQSVITNVENACKLVSTRITYLSTGSAIESSSLFKSLDPETLKS